MGEIGDGDIDHQADAAQTGKPDEARDQSAAGEPAVAIGDRVVDQEVRHHGEQRRAALRHEEGNVQEKTKAQRRQIDDDPARPDEAEQHRALWQEAAGKLCNQESEVIGNHAGVELALAGAPCGEGVGDLDDAQRLVLRGDEVEQDLEPPRDSDGGRRVRPRLAEP